MFHVKNVTPYSGVCEQENSIHQVVHNTEQCASIVQSVLRKGAAHIWPRDMARAVLKSKKVVFGTEIGLEGTRCSSERHERAAVISHESLITIF